MALEKALIQPLDDKGMHKGEPVKVLFNPTEYTIEKSNQFQNTAIPGLSAPITQFVNGNVETLTMDLFFDAYERREDVRNYTDSVKALLHIDRHLHAPPVCKFIWGKLEFKAVIERVSQRFTMFLDSGVPVRATMNVTFKEYKTLSEQFHRPFRESSDRTKQRVIQQGDQLWLMAEREYRDPAKWRLIAEANQIDNPRILEAGKKISVPPSE
ncbi:peptidoglycan-binding protein [Bacillus pseudomycoides]|uniref:CIS tube protein n=1 Tax=Bacillus pseudomycoides TaxID=64104 RepID=UPI000BED16DB|nr:LysM peptidoglycan-binding domain-containing protein [Bacillus pseudomycoides]MBD5799850.1 peptidoglycan-binding protein [Bacillus pseudomycoides]MED1476528.1 LysM peptidoglycan-binding domain-containing protein [Bacillus pseudomycoides]PDZ13447.1 peptidoglycan-binding protein [Bacillus pseudomycoides]PEO78113.1 peptidoglycan-binding protein [Bacillus pseudomycoides]